MEVEQYMQRVGRQARAASRAIARADGRVKDTALRAIASAIRRETAALLAANRDDLAAAREAGLEPAMLERLTLTEKSVATMADGVEQVAALPDPVGEISELKFRPSGIQVGKMRVPLGVIGIIYEARPNVTADAAALCIKSGNAAILRGGSEAIRCNRAIAALVHEGLATAGLPADVVQVVDTTGAGDAYMAGMLTTLAKITDVSDINHACLEEIGMWAGAAASLACQHVGGIPSLPDREEVLAFVHSMKLDGPTEKEG